MVEPSTIAVTVTVVAPAFSVTETGLTLNDTAEGVPSSSTTVSVAGLTVAPPRVPANLTFALGSSLLLSIAVTFTSCVADSVPAGMVIVKLEMGFTRRGLLLVAVT